MYFATVVTCSRLKVIGVERRKKKKWRASSDYLQFLDVCSAKWKVSQTRYRGGKQKSVLHCMFPRCVSGLVPTSCITSRPHGGNLLWISSSSQSVRVMSTVAAKFLPWSVIIIWLFRREELLSITGWQLCRHELNSPPSPKVRNRSLQVVGIHWGTWSLWEASCQGRARQAFESGRLPLS